MNDNKLLSEAEGLERRIEGADLRTRLELQPALSAVIARMRVSGTTIPRRLSSLDAALVDEAIEARFDNVPV